MDFIANEYSSISSAQGSPILAETVNIGISASFVGVKISSSKDLYTHIHKSALGWITGPGKIALPGSSEIETHDIVDNIATVFQAVLKGDGIFSTEIAPSTTGAQYDKKILTRFLGSKISDNTLFSPKQCTEIYDKLVAQSRVRSDTFTLEMVSGDKIGIVIVIDGPWGVKIRIYITF
jgi:hypothetical protein